MATGKVTVEDRQRFARARALGKVQAEDPSALIAARYDKDRDSLQLTFAGGGTMSIPKDRIPGLEAAPTSVLGSVSISPARDAISWRTLDIDIYVPGLVERVFGTRLFAQGTGRQGGRRRSKAKAAAARANGAKGGRPRKRLSA